MHSLSLRQWRVLLLTAGITGLFVLDLHVPREIPLLPYFWLPVLLGMSFATPGEIVALNLVAFGFSIASGVHFRYYTEPDYWSRLLFLVGVSLLATRFSQLRHHSTSQLQANEERYRLLAENASDVVFRIDSQGEVEWISSSAEALLGWKASELIGRSIFSLIHPHDAEQVRQGWLVCTSSNPMRMQYRIRNRQGQERWVSVSCRAICDRQGHLIGRIGSWSDAHDEVIARLHLKEQRLLLETILDNIESHIYMKDREHRYLYVNRQVQKHFGRTNAEIVGRNDSEFFSGEALEAMWAFDEEVIQGGQQLQREELIPRASGEARWFLSKKLLLQQGNEAQLIGLSTDITERKLAELELERSERKFRLLFEATLDAILLVDPEGKFMDVNPASLRIYGANDKASFLRCSPADFSPEFQPDGTRSAELIKVNISKALEQGFHQFEWLHRRLDTGKPFLGLVTLQLINLNDEPALLSLVRDISESRRYEERLRELAFRDPLTQLPNRAASLERLEQLMARPSEDSTSTGITDAGALVVVNLDLDRFQAVNDTFGLLVGNQVLIAAADTLREWLQPDDWLARLESDEFLVIRQLKSGNTTAALEFGRALQQALAKGWGERADLPICPSCSAGIALYPDHSRQPIALLQAANTALMEAKRRSQKSIYLYNYKLSTTIQQRLELELELEQAVQENQLYLHYQPEVNGAGQVIGAEALLRWTRQDGQAVSPEVFIPLAEQSGLIHPIGDWVIETACAQMGRWRDQGLALPRLAINLSAMQFETRRNELDQFLIEAISRHGIAPYQLELEVTETALLQSPERARELMERLGAAGFHIAIDDFGTGYSSLVNLHTLPVQKLKIDKSFVQRIADSKTNRAIIDSTLVIAHKLGLETTAEGIETAKQWQALKALGCDSFQGYLFGRPMPAAQLGALIEASITKD